MKFLWVCLLLLGYLSQVTSVLQFLDTPIVANIGEDETQRVDIYTFQCETTTGAVNTPPYYVDISNVNPTFPCRGCFSVRLDGTLYKLYYLPSRGPLVFDQARTYNLTVFCQDSTLNTTTTVVNVRVHTDRLPNITNPIDTSCTVNGDTTEAGEIIHQVRVTDLDADDLNFTLTTNENIPNSEFYIDNNGFIRNRYHMYTVCAPTVSFTVVVTDHKSETSATGLVTCTINNFYTAPTIAGIDIERDLPEDTPINTDIVTFDTSPLIPLVGYDIYTNPEAARWLFDIVNTHTLRLVQPLSFENFAFQRFNMSIVPYNDFCRSSGHFIYFEITDVNDIPVLKPDIVYIAVNEGDIDTAFPLVLIDQDFTDTHQYSIVAGDDNDLFDIRQSDRHIISVGNYDVDQGANPVNATFVIKVEDNSGASSNATVRMRIDDINDNRPVITDTTFAFEFEGCTYVNGQMGQITATDLDSSRNQNNVISYQAMSSGPLRVLSDGTIHINGLLAENQVYSVEVYATDHGEDPFPLLSEVPASVSLTVTACTTTQAPTVVTTDAADATTTTATTTTTTTTTTTAPSTSGNLDNGTIAAIVVGAIALPLLIILGLCLMSICCPAAFNSCKASCCGQPAPKKPVEVEPAKGTKEHDYWRPPSHRSNGKVTPEKPKSGKGKDDFDFWAQ